MRTKAQIQERFEQRHKHLSTKHLETEFGFQCHRTNKGKSTLPYHDKASLDKVRSVGRWLSKKPTIISATEKIISYVIKDGHSYSVCPRRKSGDKRKAKAEEKNSIEIEASIEYGCEQLFWFEIQTESLRRLIRDGEFFRKIWGSGDDIDVTFIEPEWICQPNIINLSQIINLNSVPEFVTENFAKTRTVEGTLGVVFEQGDARKAVGYWEHIPKHFPNGTDGWFYHDASNVQHMKDGVDKADPRGVPRFYWVLCHVIAIDEVNAGMVDLSLVQAEHAALYKFETLSSSQQALTDIANNRVKRQKENEGRPDSPSVKYLRGVDVEIPGMKISAKDFVEIIQQQQRLAGGVSDIPEYMITGDANTGNRSSLVSADGPFDRRVQREQIRFFHIDRQVLWRMVPAAVRLAADPRIYKITPNFPVAASRDIDKQVKSHALMVKEGMESMKQARKALNIDHDRAEKEIAEQEILPSQQASESQAA